MIFVTTQRLIICKHFGLMKRHSKPQKLGGNVSDYEDGVSGWNPSGSISFLQVTSRPW